MRNAVLLGAALLSGLSTAYVDSRSGWDDAGVTAFSMLIFSGILGYLGPRRPWLWALGVGLWVPHHALIANPSPGSAAMFAVLVFTFAGAYGGAALRHLLLRLASPRHRT
jgi:hypothetical protein